MTLIDTPGLVKLQVGDQKSDTVERIEKMLVSLCADPSTLVLAITPGNSDLANSGALKIAKDCDRTLERTICVVTKLDLLDQGTDAYDVLTNQVYKLKKGFVGIVNRNQKNLSQKMSFNDVLAYEQNFFRQHEKYSQIANKQGMLYLQSYLSGEYFELVKQQIPLLSMRLDK